MLSSPASARPCTSQPSRPPNPKVQQQAHDAHSSALSRHNLYVPQRKHRPFEEPMTGSLGTKQPSQPEQNTRKETFKHYQSSQTSVSSQGCSGTGRHMHASKADKQPQMFMVQAHSTQRTLLPAMLHQHTCIASRTASLAVLTSSDHTPARWLQLSGPVPLVG
jgi:hypothetical protein